MTSTFAAQILSMLRNIRPRPSRAPKLLIKAMVSLK
ncbi:Uncharacterised protein [Vibrio cholerae]|nr:Uncharacterised protein [Vibrio cholerae]